MTAGTASAPRDHGRVAKYDPLFEHLCRAGDDAVTMTFTEIDRLVGGLPKSARTHPAWWANHGPDSRHVQADAWMKAGRDVEAVDLNAETVRFSRARWNRGA